jgi:hypothetical protein
MVIDCWRRVSTLQRALALARTGDGRGAAATLAGAGVHRPAVADAGWLFDEMISAGQAASVTAPDRSEAEAVFSPALFDRAMDR